MSKFSGLKLAKWRYSGHIDVAQQKSAIFIPVDSIKIKFKIASHIESNAFGEVFRVKAIPKNKDSAQIMLSRQSS